MSADKQLGLQFQNKALQALESALQSTHGDRAPTREELVDALRLLSYPRSLRAVCRVARLFVQANKASPSLRSLPIARYEERLGVWKQIGQLTDYPEEFYEITVERKATPLYPYTGDSPAAESLLLKTQFPDLRDELEYVEHFIVALCMLWHEKYLSVEKYEGYLTAADTSDRLNTSRQGRTISSVFRWFREQPKHRQQVLVLSDLYLDPSFAGVEFVYKASLLKTKVEAGSVVDGRMSLDETKVLGNLCSSYEMTPRQVSEHQGAYAIPNFSRVLGRVRQYFDPPKPSDGSGYGARRLASYGRRVHFPDVLLKGAQPIALDQVTEFDCGHALGIYVPEDPVGDESGDLDKGDYEPEDSLTAEPRIRLFAGTGVSGMISASYAARAVVDHIEYSAALLPWSQVRLSVQALIATINWLGTLGEPFLRLVVAAMLLTGRSVEQCARLAIDDDGLKALGKNQKTHIAIGRSNKRLYVRVPRPPIDSDKLIDSPPSYLKRRDDVVSLPIPDEFKLQLDSLPPVRRSEAESKVREALRSLPASLRVTVAGIQNAMPTRLQQLTNGDATLSYLVTGRSNAPVGNALHYASYEAGVVEHLWWGAVEQLLVECGFRNRRTAFQAPTDPDVHVGSFEPLAIGEIGSRFKELRRQYLHQLGHGWKTELTHDLYTALVMLQLQLATVGRALTHPVPRGLLPNNFALVCDKRRQDGTVDRLEYLHLDVVQQLDEYFGYVAALGVVNQDLRKTLANQPFWGYFGKTLHRIGPLELQKWVSKRVKAGDALPANWARKVVRSECAGMAGRQIEALMGHFVRGRHPYRLTSDFSLRRLRACWEGEYEWLRDALGLLPVPPPSPASVGHRWPALPMGALDDLKPTRAQDSGTSLAQEIKKELRLEHAQHCLEQQNKGVFADLNEACGDGPLDQDSSDYQQALRAAYVLITQTLLKLQGKREDAKNLAPDLCEWVRTNWHLPIYESKPRPRMRNDLCLDGAAIGDLNWMQRNALDPVWDDLAHLPERDQASLASGVDLGRIAFALIWRSGVQTFSQLDAVLRAYCEKPMLACGDLRYFIVNAPCVRTGEMCRRTVLLEPVTAALLTGERAWLVPKLQQFLQPVRQRRRRELERAVERYLNWCARSRHRIPLSRVTAAARMALMIDASPIVASYAAGEFMTEDLGDDQMRYLAGLTKRKGTQNTAIALVQPEEDDRSKPVIADAGIKRDGDLVWRLASSRSRNLSQRLRLIRQEHPKSAAEVLIVGYAEFVNQYQADHGGAKKLAKRTKRVIGDRIRIVGYTLHYMTDKAFGPLLFDEALVESMAEQSEGLFEGGNHYAAWRDFRRYLKKDQEGLAGQGIEVGTLGKFAEHAVSTWLMHPSDTVTVTRRLASARSGIGNPAIREAMVRCVSFVDTYGVRRSEALQVRDEDCQGDLIRIQPYDGATLKTDWSDRCLPTALARGDIRTWIEERSDRNADLAGQALPKSDRTGPDPRSAFDAVNKIIQTQSGVPELHLHSLRHNRASLLFLGVMDFHGGLEMLKRAAPWLEEVLPDRSDVEVLLGHEALDGQGIQVISGLLGHSHPTTTLRYYIHTMCLALHGANLCRDPIDMRRAWERRIKSGQTIRRHRLEIDQEVDDLALLCDDEKRLRTNQAWQARLERWKPDAVDHDDTPRNKPEQPRDSDTEKVGQEGVAFPGFSTLEALYTALEGKPSQVDASLIESARRNLAELYAVPSSKIGSSNPRHPSIERNGAHLPKRLLAGQPTIVAVECVSWLRALAVEGRASDVQWLLSIWKYRLSAARGWLRLDGGAELGKLRDMVRLPLFLEVRGESDSSDADFAGDVRYARIRCTDETGEETKRGMSGLNWAMQMLIAMAL